MDKQTHPMPRTSLTWLPYVIAVIGMIFSLILWFFLIYDNANNVIYSINHARHWVALILGLSTAILIGFALRMLQLTRWHKESFEIINQSFKAEMAERIQAEETKQKLEKELLQGQKLQAIGTLAGGIAHDFNNILYAIAGYSEMAREDVEKDSITYKNLGKVLEATQRGHELVSRILSFSRRQQHELKSIAMRETLEGALSLLRPTVPASVNIVFTSNCSDCWIYGNQTLLHQIFVNIINNAVDAMDSEGTVNIQLDIIQPDDPILKQFPNPQPGKYCKIDIHDTGHGMDKTTMERIFEPFYTTKEVGKGTGLGLSTVHSILQEHKGEIIVNSQLGHGTTFTLLLPEHPKE